MTLLLLVTGYPQGGQGVPPAPDTVSGQPTMIRTQSVTFQPGTYDRSPNAWSFVSARAWQALLSPRITLLRPTNGG
jgi:hypothetical protein